MKFGTWLIVFVTVTALAFVALLMIDQYFSTKGALWPL
jgi:hypothetical protein